MECLLCNKIFNENRICKLNTVCIDCCNAFDQDQCSFECKNMQIEKQKYIINELKTKFSYNPLINFGIKNKNDFIKKSIGSIGIL